MKKISVKDVLFAYEQVPNSIPVINPSRRTQINHCDPLAALFFSSGHVPTGNAIMDSIVIANWAYDTYGIDYIEGFSEGLSDEPFKEREDPLVDSKEDFGRGYEDALRVRDIVFGEKVCA